MLLERTIEGLVVCGSPACTACCLVGCWLLACLPVCCRAPAEHPAFQQHHEPLFNQLAGIHPSAGVSQAVATAMLDPGIGAKRLVGYVTPGDVSPAAVVAHCRTLLVPAMVPSAIVALDTFPLLPNGKVRLFGVCCVCCVSLC
jgi:acyl-CoA synthetase (AMP-forming)/AMP-acid ligase II